MRTLVFICLGAALALFSACGDGGSADGAPAADGGGSTPAPPPPGGDDDAGQGSGATCASDADCEGRCVASRCSSPTTTDGKRSPSLGETDVDCGGPTAPKCASGGACVADDDCVSAACGAAKTCIVAASCKAGAGSGIDTCGSGEPGAQGAMNESCCTTLPLPTTAKRTLDRYEITAGRLRAFVSAIAAQNGGQRNIRGWAKRYAAAHPTSELGTVFTTYPGLLDVLPDDNDPTSLTPVQLHLGGSPIDAINTLDGCFMGPNAYGHATYWQPPEDLKPFKIGYGSPRDGVRKYSASVLDAKPMNCAMPMMLAAFCAWDGGELARTADFHEIWGTHPVTLTSGTKTTTVFIPWAAILPWGQFDWRNGHGDACPVPGWPGCIDNPGAFYAFPSGGKPADDDSPAIGAPGRFVKDVTVATSANGAGWYDVGGDLMEAAWPVGTVNPGPNAIRDVCATTAAPGTGPALCSRTVGADGGGGGTEQRQGTKIYSGPLPFIALVGYSFEGHSRRSEKYLSTTPADESLIDTGDLKPISFQYGKVGGRCARVVP